ncbi:T6SS immunity protein Tli4 family protein [Massilia pinisoli]
MRTKTNLVLGGFCFSLLFIVFLRSHQSQYVNKGTAVPVTIALSSRLNMLFKENKIVCFGRYALLVPKEAQIIWGKTSFPSEIDFLKGNTVFMKKKITQDIETMRRHDNDVEITYNDGGPIEGSWQIRYYEDKAAKQLNLYLFKTYINKQDFIFLLTGGLDPITGQSEEQALAREVRRAKSLRVRTEADIPAEEGYCIEHGFMASSFYGDQEMVNVGIYLPSLPDVTFSISSNKDAYADYPKEEFEKKKVEELSVLARVRQAQQEQGVMYPHRTVLREGKRSVQHWHGEESLIKRPNGVHDFEWGFVGTPKDVANPSEFIVNMYTKVEHNMVGAAKAASLTDDEAVALWDKLLSGLKFRVKVPGAPEGSYYFLPTKTAQPPRAIDEGKR